jgi:signal transduction histidine kinase
VAELEVAGIKFRGGKIFLVLTALTTAGGGLWGGFEFYKDYLTMKEQIQEYVAPDLSGFDKEIALTKEELNSKTDLIQTDELKNDLRQDVRRIEKVVNDVEQMVKEDSRETSQELRGTTKDIREDMARLTDKLEQAMTELEEKIDKRIKRALENPLGASN